ncbi:MAG: TM2 domain-containing protein [Flavobacteriales bacterium]|nr:TM2 domain-containing protein [Flavobacteriales bacterium]
MKILNRFSLFILAVVTISSCNLDNGFIQKRKYQKGYHVSWKKNIITKVKNETEPASFSAESTESKSIDRDKNLILTASIENKIEYSTPLIRSNAAKKDIQTKMIISTPCDIIIFENGEEVEAKVLEINENEVKYRKCNNLDGPLLVVSKSKIFAIKHANGTKTMINEPANQYSSYVSPEDEHGPQDKSQGIAIGLWFFLGILGLHRFYLGHIGIGVLYLLTGSLCGIGWIIDGILFLTGGLKPKNGKYYDKVI